MDDQPNLPATPALVAHLTERAANARRLAVLLKDDPIAPRLLEMAEELDAVIAGIAQMRERARSIIRRKQ
jgi:hypothetical protein